MASRGQEANDAAENPTMHRTAPTNKGLYWPPHVKNVEVEKPWARAKYLLPSPKNPLSHNGALIPSIIF